MLKKIIITVLAIVVVFLLIGFALPGKLEMTKSLSINAPPEYSFEEVNTLDNWNKWSYWNTLDSQMVITYGEKRSGQGGSYAWRSELFGPGKLQITESTPYKTIKADLDFIDNGVAKNWYEFAPDGDGTKLTIGFAADFGMDPISRWYAFAVMRSEMDKAFDFNLQRIKALAEAKPKYAIRIAEEDVLPIYYVGLGATMSPKDPVAITERMAKMYGELFDVLKKANVPMQGHPFSMYPRYSEESMDMICALPVDRNAKLPAKYRIMETPGGRAVKGTHLGSYYELESSHMEINRYLSNKNLQIAGAPWEVYITDPVIEKDTAKWITEIYYPIK